MSEVRVELGRQLVSSPRSAIHPIVVDDRWRGEHGIGRFSTEVLKRLVIPWRSLGGGKSPTSPIDVLNAKRMKLGSTDVVFSPGFNAGFTRARQVLVLHDLIHLTVAAERTLLKSLFYNTVVRRAARQTGVVLTVSNTSARAIRSWIRSPMVRVIVVGNGCSDSFVPEGPGAEFDRPTFIYVGNLKAHKNVGVILGALALRPEYGLVVVTCDTEEAASMAQSFGVERQMEILSAVTDKRLAELYRGASGVVQPSLLEGFGLPALEAMSCGTRVAYWWGCESVREICAGAGVAVQEATDAEEWALAFDALEEESRGGALLMPAEWSGQYRWDNVAARVGQVLAECRGTIDS